MHIRDSIGEVIRRCIPSRKRRCARKTVRRIGLHQTGVEPLEPRLLLFTASWKGAVHESITGAGLDFVSRESPDFLGLISSPIVDIGADNADLDVASVGGVDFANHHFDNATFEESVDRINESYGKALRFAEQGIFGGDSIFTSAGQLRLAIGRDADVGNDSVADWFGSILHSVQDFYAHSNWVEHGFSHLVDSGYGFWDRMIGNQPRNGVTFYTDDTPAVWTRYEDEGDQRGLESFYLDTKNNIPANDTIPRIYPAIVTGEYIESSPNTHLPDSSFGDPNFRFCHSGSSTCFGALDPNIGRLGKDSSNVNGFVDAVVLATRQTRHEFFRLEALIYNTYGEATRQAFLEAWIDDENDNVPGVQNAALAFARSLDANEQSVITPPNQAPLLLGVTPVGLNEFSINEGSELTIQVGFSDPDADRHRLVVQWGDGTNTVVGFEDDSLITLPDGAGQGFLDNAIHSLSHTYTASGDFFINVFLDDDDGNAAAPVLQPITVLNVAPKITTLSVTPIDANGFVSLAGSVQDPGNDVFTGTISWGDGSSSVFSGSNGTFAGSHSYVIDNSTPESFSITVALQESFDTGSDTATIDIPTENSGVPEITEFSSSAVFMQEGDTLTLTGSFFNPDITDTHFISVEWNDGSLPGLLPLLAGYRDFTLSHQYVSDTELSTGLIVPRIVTLTITDDDGIGDFVFASALVGNVAPMITDLNATPNQLDATNTATLTGTFTDPGILDVHTVVIDWDDGSPTETVNINPGDRTFSVLHEFLETQEFSYSVAARVIDDFGDSDEISVEVLTSNQAPLANAGGIYSVVEGNSIVLDASASSDSEQPANTLSYKWDLDNDGIFGETGPSAQQGDEIGANPTFFPPQVPGTSIVSLIVTDSQGLDDMDSAAVIITNVKPTLTSLAVDESLVQPGELISLSGSFTDAGGDDTHTVVVGWGDGTDDTIELVPGERSFGASHRYSLTNGDASSTFQISVLILDGGDQEPAIDTSLSVEVELADIYVDDDWTGLTSGIDPDGDGPAEALGVDAFATIQDAIDSSPLPVGVHIYPGQYLENVVVDRSLVLRGISGVAADVVIDPPESNGIQIFAPATDVTIENLAVTGASDGILANVAGLNLTLQNVVAKGNADDGLDVDGVASLLVNQGFFSNNGDSGLFLSAVGTVGLNKVIADANDGNGTHIATAGAVSITRSSFSENADYGVLITGDGAQSLTIDGGRLSDNGKDGVFVEDSGNVSLTGVAANLNDDDGIEIINSGDVALNRVFAFQNGDDGLDLSTVGVVETIATVFSGNEGENIESANVADFVVNEPAATVVTNVNDDGPGSLRAAIEFANSETGVDEITFAIPGIGPQAILPMSELPKINDATIVDGASQPGYFDLPLIALDGSLAGDGANGLKIGPTGAGSTIRGLAIYQFKADGILISRSDNNRVESNFLGTDPTGTIALGNGDSGLMIINGAENVIGGGDDCTANVISGNLRGVVISGTQSTGNVVAGNLIGTDASSLFELGNAEGGIEILSGFGNSVGGVTIAEPNVIAGNATGIEIRGATATDNVVQGNLIGVNMAGSAALGNDYGIRIVDGTSNTIGGAGTAGNVISGNRLNGVHIKRGSANVVEGNVIGTGLSGQTALGNKRGVVLDDTTNNLIGGVANVISGNAREGVKILRAGSTGNTIVGNRIGTDVDGTSAIANRTGILIASQASENVIGGTTSEAGNLISGNTREGVVLKVASFNLVQGNKVGTDIRGTVALGNRVGVDIRKASDNLIGGSESGAGNIVSGNDRTGIGISSISASGNVVQGNFIGTDVDGMAAIANMNGVVIGNAPSNTVTGNLISGNSNNGVLIRDVAATANRVESNVIGLDIDSVGSLPNRVGVAIVHAAGNYVGATGSGNTIAANTSMGVKILGNGATGNRIQGNVIGGSGVGNFDGIRIVSGASDNLIGGDLAAEGNIISENLRDGIRLANSAGTGNKISRNEIFSNGALGIDLEGNGVTANDPDDADAGPNNLQNFPEIQTAATNGDIQYLVTSATSNSAFPITVEFFLADSGSQEGATLLGSDPYAAPGLATFNVSGGLAADERIVATATDANGNTSEFSTTVTVAEPLLAAGGEFVGGSAENLTYASLEPVVDIAISRLVAVGFAGDLFDGVEVAIADLAGATLGLTAANVITIDVNAAGYGWLIDIKPLNGDALNPGYQLSTLDSGRRFDLLTVVMHELGHVAGLPDLFGTVAEDDLMYGWLKAGLRKSLPEASRADEVFSQF